MPTACDAMQVKLIRDAELELLAEIKWERENTGCWFKIPFPDYTLTFDEQVKKISNCSEIGELAKVLMWRYCRKENCAFRGIRKGVARVEYTAVSDVRGERSVSSY